MSKDIVLYGFDGSTYVRTVRMLLAEKGADYDQVQVNVLEGEPRQPEHLERHPFGKVPVLDHDGMRILETSAITRYLNDVLEGPSFIPDNPKDRARMDMAIGLFDSYGYGALVGVAGYHLFPGFLGNPDEAFRKQSIEDARKVLTELMKIRGDSKYIAGDKPTLADLYLAPACFYVSLTDDAAKVFDVPGFQEWWDRFQQLESYRATEPDLG
ncbi:glutathione S-transferase family protein [Halofilum ochraceum]|uniref:glutathione S-transferase family protein n=1 Tax=Halofilum ochraceum TaxID=1611323 RepID=UPI00082B4217|nr:glutathione S-transferase family protein [Halofilum ochraceum]